MGGNSMKKGDRVNTPRFLTVKIEDVLNPEQAREQGYTEPTHYDGEYRILGKSTGLNRMVFAAVRKDAE
jgi:hypothetical protein